MRTSRRVYKNPRPCLVIECVGGAELGRCYSATYYRVTSTRELTRKAIESLRDSGVLGYGQEFTCKYIGHNGERLPLVEEISWNARTEPTGHDMVNCSEVDFDGTVIQSPSINPYSGKEDPAIKHPYYVYEVEVRVDSSD